MPSLWSSYLSLSQRTRFVLGGGFILWAGIGLWGTDIAERKFGWGASEDDRKRLWGGSRVVAVARGDAVKVRKKDGKEVQEGG